MLTLYADGSCLNKPRDVGGWAFMYELDSQRTIERSGAERNTTNNRMELTAVLMGLRSLLDLGMENHNLLVISDSQYVIYGASRWIHGWKAENWRIGKSKEILNRDLWIELDELAGMFNTNWAWVRGHNGHEQNTIVDRLARGAAMKLANRV